MTMKLCTKCQTEKPETEFAKDRSKRHGPTRCKACRSSVERQRRVDNPLEQYAYNLRRNGLTIEQYDALLASQGGVCAICKTDKPRGTGRFHVDHDHVTGKTRGLLCNECNIGLGKLKDDPWMLFTAATYLWSHATP